MDASTICPQCGAWTRNGPVCTDCGAPLVAIPIVPARPGPDEPPTPPLDATPPPPRRRKPARSSRRLRRVDPKKPAVQEQDPPSPVLELLGEVDAGGSKALEKQLIGRIMGGCRVESLIGAGGMGAVFRAHHLGLDRPVALKVLPLHLATTSEMVDRFVLEARSVARIEHLNLVQVYDIRVEEGLYYIVMQYVDGLDACAQMMEQGPLPADQALDIILQAARALEAIHENGVIHRDLKPTNLLISKAGLVKITDLGLVKLLGSPPDDDPLPVAEARTSAPYQTRLSTRIGTPAYMAPEQAQRGATVDGRADIYALGATFFHLLTGRPPFEGDNTEEIFEKQRLGPVPNPRSINPWVPSRVCQVIQRMMAKRPDDRYPSAAELITDLETLSRSGVARDGPGIEYSLSRSALKFNAFLVSSVLEKKLATYEQIEDCLRLQGELVSFGSPRSLVEVFQEKSILKRQRILSMLADFATSETQRHNSLFGRIAVGAGLLTREGLREGLKAQRTLARQGRDPMRLGEVLVRRGFLTPDMVDVILRAQENYVRNIDDSFFEQAAREAGVGPEAVADAIRALHAVGGDDPRSLLQILVESEHLTPVQAQAIVAEQVRRLVDVMAVAAPAKPSRPDTVVSPMDSGEWSPARLHEIASELPGGKLPSADPAADSTEIVPGPWGWLSPGAEVSDRVSLQTLVAWIGRGRITGDSMVRGPTTGGRWTFASHTPAVSKHLGLCPHCQEKVTFTDELCLNCGRFLDWPAVMTVSDPLADSDDEKGRSMRQWING